MKIKEHPIVGGLLVLVGLVVIELGGWAVSIIGTKGYSSADAWSSGVLICGIFISAFGVWISGVKLKGLGRKLNIKISKKGIKFFTN